MKHDKRKSFCPDCVKDVLKTRLRLKQELKSHKYCSRKCINLSQWLLLKVPEWTLGRWVSPAAASAHFSEGLLGSADKPLNWSVCLLFLDWNAFMKSDLYYWRVDSCWFLRCQCWHQFVSWPGLRWQRGLTLFAAAVSEGLGRCVQNTWSMHTFMSVCGVEGFIEAPIAAVNTHLCNSMSICSCIYVHTHVFHEYRWQQV